MKTLLLTALPLLCIACASSEPAARDDAPQTASDASSGASSECDMARYAAEAAWRKEFDRVPDLSPADRDAMAKEHSMSSDAELGELEATAREAGDDTMLEAIAATQKAREMCER